MSEVTGIYVKFTTYGHVASNSENFYFSLNSVIKFWGNLPAVFVWIQAHIEWVPLEPPGMFISFIIIPGISDDILPWSLKRFITATFLIGVGINSAQTK